MIVDVAGASSRGSSTGICGWGLAHGRPTWRDRLTDRGLGGPISAATVIVRGTKAALRVTSRLDGRLSAAHRSCCLSRDRSAGRAGRVLQRPQRRHSCFTPRPRGRGLALVLGQSLRRSGSWHGDVVAANASTASTASGFMRPARRRCVPQAPEAQAPRNRRHHNGAGYMKVYHGVDSARGGHDENEHRAR